jgi:hypothetical protein
MSYWAEPDCELLFQYAYAAAHNVFVHQVELTRQVETAEQPVSLYVAVLFDGRDRVGQEVLAPIVAVAERFRRIDGGATEQREWCFLMGEADPHAPAEP